MKQEGSARRRGADKAKPPPGGEQEPPPPAPQDVEMKEEAAAGSGSTGEGDGKAATTEHSQRELDTVTLEDIKEHVRQLEKAVSGKEPRFVLRALRMLPSTSRRLNHYVLYKAVHGFFTSNNATRDFLLPFLEEVSGASLRCVIGFAVILSVLASSLSQDLCETIEIFVVLYC